MTYSCTIKKSINGEDKPQMMRKYLLCLRLVSRIYIKSYKWSNREISKGYEWMSHRRR